MLGRRGVGVSGGDGWQTLIVLFFLRDGRATGRELFSLRLPLDVSNLFVSLYPALLILIVDLSVSIRSGVGVGRCGGSEELG